MDPVGPKIYSCLNPERKLAYAPVHSPGETSGKTFQMGSTLRQDISDGETLVVVVFLIDPVYHSVVLYMMCI